MTYGPAYSLPDLRPFPTVNSHAKLSGGSIDIGGADTTSFHVDGEGNMWMGAAGYVSAPFRVSKAGAVEATSGSVSLGTIQTATSGPRVALVNPGEIKLYDSTGALQMVLSVDTGGQLLCSGPVVALSHKAGSSTYANDAVVSGNTTLAGGLVSYGAADSAGTGFRTVMVPN